MNKDIKLSGIVVIGVGRRGKNIVEQIEKESWETPCISFLDETEIDSWEEMSLCGEFMEIIVAGMDNANDEALVERLVRDAEKNKVFTVAILGAHGNRYMEIAEKCKAVIVGSKDLHISEEEQDHKLYAAVRGLVLANDIESDVFINASDIAAVLEGECQFGEGTDKDAVVAVKQAMKGLSGRNCLLCFLVSEGVLLYDIHDAMAEIQEGLGEDANIIFGITKKRERKGRILAFLPDKPVEKIIQVMAYTGK